MASGYVIAAILEAAGLIGLAIAQRVLRAERQVRAADLRGFLRSGQSAQAASVPAAPGRMWVAAPRVIVLPVALRPRGAGPADESAARSALLRALERDEPADATPLSAG